MYVLWYISNLKIYELEPFLNWNGKLKLKWTRFKLEFEMERLANKLNLNSLVVFEKLTEETYVYIYI